MMLKTVTRAMHLLCEMSVGRFVELSFLFPLHIPYFKLEGAHESAYLCQVTF